MSTPALPDDDLAAALADLAADPTRRPLLVALDFDGTLSPLIDDPGASRMLPQGAAALALMASLPGVELALVSGRSLVDLHRRSDPPVGTVLIGSHGGERGRVGPYGLERDPILLEPAQAELLIRLGSGLTAAARGRDGVWVQNKPAAAVLHTRMAGKADSEAATAVAVALADTLGAEAMRGKDVVEISVLQVTKGQALAALRDELGAVVVLYAGDDTTDEHAFEVLSPADLTIKIGAGQTVARLRATDPDSFCAQLAGFARSLAR